MPLRLLARRQAYFGSVRREYKITVPLWTGFVGQYDNRIWDRQFRPVEFKSDANVIGIKPGYIKRDNIAWFCTHRHLQGNESYQFCYLFRYAVDIPAGASEITLPYALNIKIFAMTMGNNENAIRSATPLYDDFTDRPEIPLRTGASIQK